MTCSVFVIWSSLSVGWTSEESARTKQRHAVHNKII